MTSSSPVRKQTEDSGNQPPIARDHLLPLGIFLSVPIVVNLVAGVAHTIKGDLNPGLYELAIAFFMSWVSILIMISEVYISLVEET